MKYCNQLNVMNHPHGVVPLFLDVYVHVTVCRVSQCWASATRDTPHVQSYRFFLTGIITPVKKYLQATVHRFLWRRKCSPIDGETQQDEAGGLHVASRRPRRLPPYLTLLKDPVSRVQIPGRLSILVVVDAAGR